MLVSGTPEDDGMTVAIFYMRGDTCIFLVISMAICMVPSMAYFFICINIIWAIYAGMNNILNKK